ncbi:MAG: hypothetical protein ACXIUZ_07370 [Lysobacteraceae bacterium]|mgnify:CR=1 FL=1|jgi:DUF4097 and DUF4098 domain-containing protein YvlB
MKALVPVVLFALLPALALADPPDISRTNGAITVEEGESYGRLRTVNGAIRVGDRASAGDISTVNGAITLGDGVSAASIRTTNGAIRAGGGTVVDGDVASVNGSIVMGADSRVGGDLGNVNGGITLSGTTVEGTLKTSNGSITIEDGSRVVGGIEVGATQRRLFSWGRGNQGQPRIVIGRDSEVVGPMVFQRDVELFVHDSARIGRVDGSQPQRFSGDRP